MDSIVLKNMHFFAYHGVHNAERELGQKFEIDLHLHCDLQRAGETDRLEETVDYTKVYRLVRGVMKEERFYLLERLGSAIAQRIFVEFEQIHKICIAIRKPYVPIDGALDYVEVNLCRER